MTEKLKQKLNKGENGEVIVEATIVFPIMFIVLFFLIYMGNAFYLKAKVESLVKQEAIIGANYCADPMLETIKKTGSVPSLDTLETEPYRYIFGGMDSIELKISQNIQNELGVNTIGFFKNMKPQINASGDKIAKFNNYIVYSTFSVDVDYKIKFPIRLLGESKATILHITARAEVPVNDTAEFIRNTDMVVDYAEQTKVGDFIKSAFGKVNAFISSFSKK